MSDELEQRKTRKQHGLSKTIEYASFISAKDRCNNPRNKRYHRYGGRGIEFRFDHIQKLIDAAGKRPSMKHSLDRIDNDGHYEKGNVRWATNREQCLNTSYNRNITFNGRTLSASEWGLELGGKKFMVFNRLRSGWCEPCAVSVPANKRGKRDICPHRKRDLTNKRFFTLTVNGVTKTLRDWADETGIKATALYSRVAIRGWEHNRAISTPMLRGGSKNEKY